jgi:hypothetical protein
MHFVLNGLQGKATDTDGEVTWLGLSSYVMKQVRKEAPTLVNREQRPNLLGNMDHHLRGDDDAPPKTLRCHTGEFTSQGRAQRVCPMLSRT